MANEQNLIPFTSEQSREEAAKNGKKGGINSGKARRERKTIQKILSEYLDKDVKSNPNLHKLAEEVGIKNKQSIKELVAAVCLLNTLKSGDVEKLIKLTQLLGEETEYENGNKDVERTLAVIKDCAYGDRN